MPLLGTIEAWPFFYKKVYPKALADYTKAIQLDPQYANAYNNRGLAHYHSKAYDKAIADFTRAIQLKPTFAEVLQ